MVKLLSFIKFLPEVPCEVGRELYEREHAPLVIRLLPMISEYRRNYFASPQAIGVAGAAFDAVTEICFENQEAMGAFRKVLQGEAGVTIRDDAARFMQSDATVTCLVEVAASPIGSPENSKV